MLLKQIFIIIILIYNLCAQPKSSLNLSLNTTNNILNNSNNNVNETNKSNINKGKDNNNTITKEKNCYKTTKGNEAT